MLGSRYVQDWVLNLFVPLFSFASGAYYAGVTATHGELFIISCTSAADLEERIMSMGERSVIENLLSTN